MKPTIPALAVVALLAAGGAQAQTTSPSTTATPAPTTAAPAQPSTPSAGAATPSSTPPAVTTRGAAESHTTAPVPGANSFTEGEARRRIEAAGYANVTDLRKDDQGIWRGRASRNGAQVAVALDFQGNIVAGH